LSRLLPVIFWGFLGFGCAASPPAEPTPRDASPAKPPLEVSRAPASTLSRRPSVVPTAAVGDVVVARVGGTEIRRSELGELVIRYFRDTANEALNQLIDERIIEAEAKAHGITLAGAGLEESVDEELTAREGTIRVQYGADVSLERFLKERYGVTVAEHRRDIAHLVRIRLLRDRVIRYHQIGEERAELRDALFADLESARRASRAARGGADLARLAKEYGAREGVAIPPVPRSELRPKELGDAVFALAAGEVSDPILVEEGEKKIYHVFKMVLKTAPRDVSFAEARDEIGAELEKRPLDQYEYVQWARQMRELYRVEVLR